MRNVSEPKQGESGLYIPCPYEGGVVPVEKCRKCGRKADCPSVSGW